MDGLVDSHQRDLNPFEIVTIAVKNTSDYPLEVALPAIMTEIGQPNAKQRKIGNTLFSVLMGKNNEAFFKAFNADTPVNFIENSREFCVWARNDLGLKIAVTEFNDPAISKLFHIIAKNPPLPNMGFTEYRTEDGGTRIVLSLGE